jgi:hypothetical protein
MARSATKATSAITVPTATAAGRAFHSAGSALAAGHKPGLCRAILSLVPVPLGKLGLAKRGMAELAARAAAARLVLVALLHVAARLAASPTLGAPTVGNVLVTSFERGKVSGLAQRAHDYSALKRMNGAVLVLGKQRDETVATLYMRIQRKALPAALVPLHHGPRGNPVATDAGTAAPRNRHAYHIASVPRVHLKEPFARLAHFRWGKRRVLDFGHGLDDQSAGRHGRRRKFHIANDSRRRSLENLLARGIQLADLPRRHAVGHGSLSFFYHWC